MFVTSTTRDATSTNIADYNTVVSNRAMAGVTAMRTYANDFTALVSTPNGQCPRQHPDAEHRHGRADLLGEIRHCLREQPSSR